MRYKWRKFGFDPLIITPTLLGKVRTLSVVLLPLRDFTETSFLALLKIGYDGSRAKLILFKKNVTCQLCHSIARTLSTCAKNSAIFVAIGP